MQYYTSKFCKDRIHKAIDDLDDAIKRLNNYQNKLKNINLFYRDTDLLDSHYTNDIIELTNAIKSKIEDTKEVLISESFEEVN